MKKLFSPAISLMKILLIEDEKLIQMSLKMILEKNGAQVDTSSDGKSAIRLLQANEYDRIICDLMLQDISGFDILEEAKKKYSIKQISDKFIIITAYSSPQITERVKAWGCLLIPKPFDDMNNVINTFLGRAL